MKGNQIWSHSLKISHDQAVCPITKKANDCPGCIRRSVYSRSRELILPSAQPCWDHNQTSWSMSRLPSTVGPWTYWREFSEGPWTRLGKWSIWHMRRWWKSWDCLASRRLRKIIISVYKFLMGRNDTHGARLFSFLPSDRTRGNRHKLKYRKFHLNIRLHFFFNCESGQRLKCLPRGCLHPWKSSKAIWMWS